MQCVLKILKIRQTSPFVYPDNLYQNHTPITSFLYKRKTSPKKVMELCNDMFMWCMLYECPAKYLHKVDSQNNIQCRYNFTNIISI